MARRGYELLDSWRVVPGVEEDSVDSDVLESWVAEARELLREADRSEIGEQRIGHILRYAPKGSDGLWPHEAVRDLLEEIESRDVETGLAIELRNSRGVTTRAPLEGGGQERELVAQYSDAADVLAGRWG